MRDDLIIDCFAGGGGASVGIEMALGRQVARIGNSVVPIMAKKLIESNCGYLKTMGSERRDRRSEIVQKQRRVC